MSDVDRKLPEGMIPVRDPEFAAWMRKAQADYLWFLSQFRLREPYGDRFVVLHNRQVIGTGDSYEGAEADARRRAEDRGEPLPPRQERSTFPVPPMVWIDDPSIPPLEAASLTRNEFTDLSVLEEQP